ncbi:hypothetical protein CR66_08340 [Campylobacter mucosalis]|uniref:Uncharacterized protein n=1 Tax=Campylobacter mucosalis CCUG 21559 TaxID=1032067 RepID=A0A6G5QDY7_9BACT|nr:hypothetical protein [Campylobacter mucosalis]KEA45369.1 hypothetical protein CR66_08340 [Campylobacter mucosalis]QCD43834.1 hypothetical protein CMUC_0007 [Campylobacter mucosalis CCUG 21559]QKF62186.1 hypothetical protein CMCT_0007 [Campylobacter mucosalis]
MIDAFDIVKMVKSDIYQNALKECVKYSKIKYKDDEISISSCLEPERVIKLSEVSILNIISSINSRKFRAFFCSLINLQTDIGYVDSDKIYDNNALVLPAIYFYFLENSLENELEKFVKKLGMDSSFYENLILLEH